MAVSRGTLMAGLVVVLGLVVAFTSTAPAQTKKKDPPKTTSGKTDPVVKSKGRVDALVNSQGAEQVAYIDELIEKMWQENKVDPSDRCSDYEFIRRASLDII